MRSIKRRKAGNRPQALRLVASSAAGAVIPFAHNPIATAEHIARALPELRVTATWDNRAREAVHITGADQPMGSGVFVADGEQLVIADNGTLRVEECGHA